MKQSGYIKLYRQLLDWEWYNDIPTKTLFIHLLLTSNWSDSIWHGIEIKQGQKITSRLKLSQETGLTISQTKTALKHLQLTGEITISTTNKYTLITVENYSKYQSIRSADSQQNGSELTTEKALTDQQTESQIATNKEYKNKRNKEIKNIYTFPDSEDAVKISNKEYGEIIDQYNTICTSLPQVAKITEYRKKKIRTRLNNYSKDELIKAFQLAEQSDFLSGRSGNWRARFDWIIDSDKNLQKILEGNYNETQRSKYQNWGETL